ncbi:hypothetical protein FGU71_04295 [Erythrobacter insulae]|uniref:Uncharacterized protein n=1 Tax=Erythrobacter insulae TaxID=2584124 RepID=A0A547PAN1_9SPHN|nr:hypothetical protein [Erythrobacter insulae]TRD11147.1 hypothetical protein FGU71_04295 [Erythrobacter insulae]
MDAANRDCAAIAALTEESDAKLNKLAIAMNRDDRLDLTYDGKPGLLRNATECGMFSQSGDFELVCQWDFGNDPGAASALFSAYRIRIAKCLAVPFLKQESGSDDETAAPERYRADIEHPDNSETTIKFALRETNYGETPRFVVHFDVSRSD